MYSTREQISSEDVGALALRLDRRRSARLAVARAEVGPSTLRTPIAAEVKTYVWQRDGGRCATCGSQQRLEFDHIIPVSLGGSSSARNLQLLCEGCNRAKGGDLL